MNTYRLIASKAAGSMIVEAALALPSTSFGGQDRAATNKLVDPKAKPPSVKADIRRRGMTG